MRGVLSKTSRQFMLKPTAAAAVKATTERWSPFSQAVKMSFFLDTLKWTTQHMSSGYAHVAAAPIDNVIGFVAHNNLRFFQNRSSHNTSKVERATPSNMFRRMSQCERLRAARRLLGESMKMKMSANTQGTTQSKRTNHLTSVPPWAAIRNNVMRESMKSTTTNPTTGDTKLPNITTESAKRVTRNQISAVRNVMCRITCITFDHCPRVLVFSAMRVDRHISRDNSATPEPKRATGTAKVKAQSSIEW
mmetsp:Transcript_29690/g.78768  ORF Transcript_29690/g.78768 Transcript_29690/m.78768 type:complete len:248 (-) Transcript_29690:646-1389(-)